MGDELIKAAHSAVKREDWTQAWPMLNAILNEEPDRAEALYLMGATMRALGNLGLAYQVLRKALAEEQRQPNLWMTYAATLHDLNRWDEAREALLHVHKAIPSDPMPLANIGATFVQQGKWHDALNFCNEALKLDPENHVARITANFANLSLGRWKDAWRDAEYMYGHHLQIRVYNPEDYEEPMWDGSKGKTVVVQADQGVGDIIMFSQCLPEMAKDCKEVILEVAPRLVSLMKRSFPMITVEGTLKDDKQHWAHDRLGTDKQVDAHVHISFLGRWYRNLDKDFPRKPYIKVNEQKMLEWRDVLEQYPRPWVGIAWKGGIHNTQSHLRSMTLMELSPVLVAGGSFIDLSYQDNKLEISRWNVKNAQQVIDPGINVEDFENTVALIAALDEVVTVTTTVAHVCGSIGKRAHVLTPSVPQWRYAYRHGDGTEMIWYPKDSVKMYRQAQGETDWLPAVRRVANDLTTIYKRRNYKEEDMRNLTGFNKKELIGWIGEDAMYGGKKGKTPQLIQGLKDNDDEARKAKDDGRQFVYIDHSYFMRGWHQGHFRAIRNNIHLTHILDRPDDRLKKFKVIIEPWRRTGNDIVIIPPAEYQVRHYRCENWTLDTEVRLKQITDRPIRIKHSKFSSLREYLKDTWAVVTYASVAGVEAALMGIPVFSTEECPSWPINSGTLEQIETPTYAENRHQWASSLCYASWHVNELKSIKWFDYQYELLNATVDNREVQGA